MGKLGDYLKRHDLRQADFAAKVGTTQANISKLCGSEPRISTDMALKIEAATGGEVPLESWPQFAALAGRRQQVAGRVA